MVQAYEQLQDNQGDGLERPIQYAKFRTDKTASPGYSRELISVNVDPKYYDRMHEVPLPEHSPDLDTFLKLFKRNVAQRPHEPFLGTRQQIEDSADGKP